MDPSNGRVRLIGPVSASVGEQLWEEAKEKVKKLMDESMIKKLPPTTPTRREPPSQVAPGAPKKKSKWRAGNRYAALASSSHEQSTDSITHEIPSADDSGRRRGRASTPACVAPPTPQLAAAPSSTVMEWHEYEPIPELPMALDLNDYDEWGLLKKYSTIDVLYPNF